ncbi:MAG: hypothetical protein QM687_11795 [Ferruginibacter sp.]
MKKVIFFFCILLSSFGTYSQVPVFDSLYLHYCQYKNGQNAPKSFRFKKKDLIREYFLSGSNSNYTGLLQINTGSKDTIDISDSLKSNSHLSLLLKFLIEKGIKHIAVSDSFIFSKPIVYREKNSKLLKYIIVKINLWHEEISGSIIYKDDLPYQIFLYTKKEKFYLFLAEYYKK